MSFDAILMISFGGPEKPEDIRPFLERVAHGRRIPPGRLEEVARHYEMIGGKSPLNELTFAQARALRARLSDKGIDVPVYVGMRNWHPFLPDTVRRMHADGVRHVVAVIMALQQSQSSWEQYQRNLADALAETGLSLDVDYAPPLFDHPKFVEAAALRVAEGLSRIPEQDRPSTPIIFTAHSIPTSDPFVDRYVSQLDISARLVAERLDCPAWQLAYQSRSGRPEDPWLEPDIKDALRDLAARGDKTVVIVPIGFVCDHVEVLYDLDIEAASTAATLGLTAIRANAVNSDETFVEALAEVLTGILHA